MNDINDFIVNYANFKPIKRYLYILIILFIIVLIILFKGNYYEYIKSNAYVDTNCNLIIYSQLSDINKYINGKTIIINNNKHSYIVEKIDEQLLIEENINYKKITLKLVLDKNLCINNNVVETKILKDKIKVINKLLNI